MDSVPESWRFARIGDKVRAVVHWKDGIPMRINIDDELALVSEPYVNPETNIALVDYSYSYGFGRNPCMLEYLGPTTATSLEWAKREIAELKQRVSELEGSHA